MSFETVNDSAIKIFTGTKEDISKLAIGEKSIEEWIKAISKSFGPDPSSGDLASCNSELFKGIDFVYSKLSEAELHYNYLHALVKKSKAELTIDFIEESKSDGKKIPMERVNAIIDGKMADDDMALEIASMKLAFLKSVLAKFIKLSERLDQQAKILFAEKKYSTN